MITLQHDDLLTLITVNPRVIVGKPTIRGLRIPVDQIVRVKNELF